MFAVFKKLWVKMRTPRDSGNGQEPYEGHTELIRGKRDCIWNTSLSEDGSDGSREVLKPILSECECVTPSMES